MPRVNAKCVRIGLECKGSGILIFYIIEVIHLGMSTEILFTLWAANT